MPLLEPGPIGTLRCRHRVAELVLVVPPRPELAPALVPGSWTELVKARWQNLPQRGSELPSASPAPERPWPLLPSGEATGSSVASAGVGAAFGFAGIVAGEALAVASGVLVSVCFSGEATGSAVAVTPFSFVALGVAVDPGGQVIQHSAPAGNDRNVNPLTGTSIVSRRDFAFMIHPHFVF